MRPLLLALLLFGCMVLISSADLPLVVLPKGAQHNTFGELPIVEILDDGDFFEIDGAEYKKYKLTVNSGGKSWETYF